MNDRERLEREELELAQRAAFHGDSKAAAELLARIRNLRKEVRELKESKGPESPWKCEICSAKGARVRATRQVQCDGCWQGTLGAIP